MPKSLEIYAAGMKKKIPEIIISEAKRTNTPIVVWDPIRKEVKKIRPDEIEEYLEHNPLEKL